MFRFSAARRCVGIVAIAFATFGAGNAANAQAVGAPPADFGSPPSGEVPIIFNDHHVYAKPDKLKQNRVLAALIRKNAILVPMRSLFEQMGATVAYDAETKMVDVSKAGADVKVTVGKSIVTINGEDRPLDVPPEVYKGSIVVPLRVLSEGMGAYVQWVSDRRLVVVRYFESPPPTPAPTMPPTPAPTVAPTATLAPTPAPTKKPMAYEKFIAGDYDISPLVYNELSPGNSAMGSYQARAAVEFPVAGLRLMVEGNYHHLVYSHNADLGYTACPAGTAGCNTVNGSDPNYITGACPSTHDPGCVTTVGAQNVQAINGLGQAYIPGFTAKEDSADARLGLKIFDPRFYLVATGFFKHYNYLGYPNLFGVGGGLEKLPDLESPFSVYGDLLYYPNVQGSYRYPTSDFLGSLSGQKINLSYTLFKYEVGATINFGKSPLYLDLGYQGERLHGKQNAPSDTQETSPFVGLGLHF